MRRAIGRGCTRADFGRSKVGTGPWSRKRIWGFRETPLTYAVHGEVRSVNPLDPKYRLKVAAWQKLPLWLANRLGPPIARGLADGHALPRPPHPLSAGPRPTYPLLAPAPPSGDAGGSISPASPTMKPNAALWARFGKPWAGGSARRMLKSASEQGGGWRPCADRRQAGAANCSNSPALRAFVERMLPKVDTVFRFSGQMAQFVPAGIRQRFVMDFGDVDFGQVRPISQDGAGRCAGQPARGQPPSAFERATAECADLCLFVSEAEAALFRERTGLANIRALSNGIDVDFFDPAAAFPRLHEAGPLILFTGQMDYAPNADAVAWFADEVLPDIPKARFVIAGRTRCPRASAAGGNG